MRLGRVWGNEVSMKKFIGLGSVAVGGLFLASCVTYPYDTAFSSCEREANACYRLCEDIPDENGYVACQAHCDRDIDRCFDQAYSPYSTGYYAGYGYSSPWYGRYGAWYPDSGYFLSFNFYDRYGYRKKRQHPRGDWNWRDGRRDYDDHRDRDGRNGNWRDRDGRRDDDRNNRDGRNRRPNGNTQPPNSGATVTPVPQPAPRATPIPQGERRIDTPRRPNRVYRNNRPNGAQDGAASPPSGQSSVRTAPPPETTYSRPARPAYTPPARPTYTPPQRTQPEQPAPPPAQPADNPTPAELKSDLRGKNKQRSD